MSFRLVGRLTSGSLMLVLLACQSSVGGSGGAEQPAAPPTQAAPTQAAPTQTAAQPAPPQPAPVDPVAPPAQNTAPAGPTAAPAPPGSQPAAPAPVPAPTALPTTIPTALPTAIPTAIPTTWPPTTPPQTAPTEAVPAPAKVRTEGDRILLPGNVVFETGKATMSATPENQSVLNQLKQFLVDNPRVSTVRIEGYTDNVGKPEGNLKLSGERALAIKQWLVAAGIPAERVIAVGFGQEKPVADNATPAGRAQNRRTEFKIAAVNKRPYRGVPVNGGGTEFK